MNQVVASSAVHELRFKAALYEATVQPTLARYETMIVVLTLMVIVLTIAVLIILAIYYTKSEECNYYKQCLNANFSWWK